MDWTFHVQDKMRFYKLSKARVRRVIKSPLRIEEGIAPDTVGVMQPSSYKGVGKERTWNQEIWVMYSLHSRKSETQNTKHEVTQKKKSIVHNPLSNANSITVISAWRYPGKTSPRDELPQEIMQEIREALYKKW